MLEDKLEESLEELESMMAGLSQEWVGRDQGNDREEGEAGGLQRSLEQGRMSWRRLQNSYDGQDMLGRPSLSFFKWSAMTE